MLNFSHGILTCHGHIAVLPDLNLSCFDLLKSSNSNFLHYIHQRSATSRIIIQERSALSNVQFSFTCSVWFTEHITFIKDVAATCHPENLPYLLNMLQKRGNFFPWSYARDVLCLCYCVLRLSTSDNCSHSLKGVVTLNFPWCDSQGPRA